MKIKEYRIKATADDTEHAEMEKRIKGLFAELNKEFDADMEVYVQPLGESKKRFYLYGLGSKKNLQMAR